jgi:type II secretion system protein G
MFSVTKKTNKGFTLIELLVVIAIIGLLSSVVLASLNVAKEKARDARRASDLIQLERALQFYYDDNGTYPTVAYTEPNYFHNGNMTGGLVTILDGYINPPPNDPLRESGRAYYYVYKRSVAWITANSWTNLTSDCADKVVIVVRSMESSGPFRQDCAMSVTSSISIVLD